MAANCPNFRVIHVEMTKKRQCHGHNIQIRYSRNTGIRWRIYDQLARETAPIPPPQIRADYRIRFCPISDPPYYGFISDLFDTI